MTEKLIRDSKGATLKVLEYDGHLLQPFPGAVQKMKDLPHFVPRDDDIFTVAYPKSGTHWIWEICMRLLTNSTDENFNLSHGKYFLDFSGNDVLSEQPSPRVFVSHLPFELFSRASGLLQKKMIHIVRNPKDVAVSQYKQTRSMDNLYGYEGDWSGYFELFLQGQVDIGSWFDHVLEWERFRNSQPSSKVLLLYYEDLKENLLGGIRRIASFLELSGGEEFYRAVADQCTFSVMKKNRDATASEGLLSMYSDRKSRMYRKGEVGDWKNYFTVDQSQRFDDVYAERMDKSNMDFRFTL